MRREYGTRGAYLLLSQRNFSPAGHEVFTQPPIDFKRAQQGLSVDTKGTSGSVDTVWDKKKERVISVLLTKTELKSELVMAAAAATVRECN